MVGQAVFSEAKIGASSRQWRVAEAGIPRRVQRGRACNDVKVNSMKFGLTHKMLTVLKIRRQSLSQEFGDSLNLRWVRANEAVVSGKTEHDSSVQMSDASGDGKI